MHRENQTKKRPPIVVVMGHVDHGKSTLLDYIRKENTVLSEHGLSRVDGITRVEAGGITQHIGAYEIIHKGEDGEERSITFIDTPGHAAFNKMRERGARVADVAVLVVAADDGVKPQTIEALEQIKTANIPFVVAINKLDKQGADSERTKQMLAEQGVFVEGYGGTVPVAEVSAIDGAGIPDLLSMIVLIAELENLIANPTLPASGVVVEAHRDTKMGTHATLIITNGTLATGDFILVGGQISPVRAMYNFRGKLITKASFSSPVKIIGFTQIPEVGEKFKSFKNKRLAETENSIGEKKDQIKSDSKIGVINVDGEKKMNIAIVLKADSSGTLEAIERELLSRNNDKIWIRVVSSGVGKIAENDVKNIVDAARALVIGFGVEVDAHARELLDKHTITPQLFNVIYKLTEWFDEYITSVTPKELKEELIGQAKILKTFSRTKDRQVVGGIVKNGKLMLGKRVRIVRRDEQVGEGKIVNLQRERTDVKQISEGEQFGIVIETHNAIAEGDLIEQVEIINTT